MSKKFLTNKYKPGLAAKYGYSLSINNPHVFTLSPEISSNLNFAICSMSLPYCTAL